MAEKVLREHADGLKQLAELLLEREVVFTEDVERIFGKRKKDIERERREAAARAVGKEAPEQASVKPDPAAATPSADEAQNSTAKAGDTSVTAAAPAATAPAADTPAAADGPAKDSRPGGDR